MSGEVLVSAATAARAVPYVAALVAGGVPGEAIRVVTPAAPARAAAAAVAAELVAGAAGLLLCGGSDVEPWRYGEAALPAAGLELAPERDALEWELLAAAREQRLPVFGICRGFQVLNVFLGGSLWQDLPSQRPGAVAHEMGQPPDLLAHAVRVLAPQAPLGERLAGAAQPPLVNSRHHQGVKRLGAGLLAVAEAPDGLIEAAILGDGGERGQGGERGDRGEGGAAGDGGWWVRGVEWHPENLLHLAEQLALWQDFAAALGVHGPRGAGRRPAMAAAAVTGADR